MANDHPRKDFLIDQLKRAHLRDAWHGQSVSEILKGVTAAQAAAKPIPSAHSIWELVLHIEAWNRLIEKRIRTEKLEKMTVRLDWPSVPKSKNATAWKASVAKMHHSIASLYAYTENHDVSMLDRPVTGKPYNVEHMLHGVVQHNLYHAGQIALLKKAVASSQ